MSFDPSRAPEQQIPDIIPEDVVVVATGIDRPSDSENGQFMLPGWQAFATFRGGDERPQIGLVEDGTFDIQKVQELQHGQYIAVVDQSPVASRSFPYRGVLIANENGEPIEYRDNLFRRALLEKRNHFTRVGDEPVPGQV